MHGRILRWCARPGALYTTVCLGFVGLQSLNLMFKPLRLGELLRVHAFGLGAAALSFAIVLLWMDGPRGLLTQFLGGTILMTLALIAPFALNYSKRMAGPG
jgi:hypothetical protein